MTDLLVIRAGIVPWEPLQEAQRLLRDARRRDEIPDTLLMHQHPPTITLGTASTEAEELPAAHKSKYKDKVPVYRANRGGAVTYHEPGQCLAAPIIDVKELDQDITAFREWQRGFEAATIDTLAGFGVTAHSTDYVGAVFTAAGEVIMNQATHIADGILGDGIAINVNNSVEAFSWINPCIQVPHTSVQKELGHPVSLHDFERAFAEAFAAQYQYAPIEVEPPGLIGLRSVQKLLK